MLTLHLIRELNVRLHYVYSAFDPRVKCKAALCLVCTYPRIKCRTAMSFYTTLDRRVKCTLAMF